MDNTAWYAYDEETGMEYEHDGEYTRRQWHDGVGQVTMYRQSLDDFLDLMDEIGAPVTEVGA